MIRGDEVDFWTVTPWAVTEFGSWDAAWDCLTELDWPAGEMLAVYLPLDAHQAIVETDLEVFLELLEDACRHWAERGRALCLLVASPQPGPGCLARLASLERLA